MFDTFRSVVHREVIWSDSELGEKNVVAIHFLVQILWVLALAFFFIFSTVGAVWLAPGGLELLTVFCFGSVIWRSFCWKKSEHIHNWRHQLVIRIVHLHRSLRR